MAFIFSNNLEDVGVDYFGEGVRIQHLAGKNKNLDNKNPLNVTPTEKEITNFVS